MEREVLGQKSPLFGRRTGQLLLKPLDYLRSRLFLPGFTQEEQLMIYGAVGGTPLYLSRIDNTRSLHDNIVDVFLRPVSYFYDEPLFLLREELQEPSVYNAILEAIARGASRANEIATRIGEPPAKCLKYIKTLRDLDIVYKEKPLGERETSRRTLYGIADHLFRFWYRYVFGNKTLLETNAWEVVWKRIIQPDYSTYMGLVFEQVCRSYLLQQNAQGQLPLLITQLGRWWGTDSHTHQQVEIDLAGTGGTQYLFAECKWRNEPMPMSVLETLKHRADIYRRQRGETWWYLFSKSGFTPALQKTAAVDEHVVLCDLAEIMQL
jgi:AAA+ ATPase superfamily predicted ATPase